MGTSGLQREMPLDHGKWQNGHSKKVLPFLEELLQRAHTVHFPTQQVGRRSDPVMLLAMQLRPIAQHSRSEISEQPGGALLERRFGPLLVQFLLQSDLNQ